MTELNKEGLLPCPFCGPAKYEPYVVHNDGLYAVHCGWCEISGTDHEEKAKAIKAWNTRAHTPAQVVKPLEWWVSDTSDRIADTLIGRYQIQNVAGNKNCRLFGPLAEIKNGLSYWPETDAKAAAQADYERRIMSALSPAPAAQEGAHPDDLAVDRFATEMKAKLAKKRDEGRGGWDRKDECTAEFLSQLLRNHVEKGDPLDVGNLAMMLHQRGERVTPAPQDEAEPVAWRVKDFADGWILCPTEQATKTYTTSGHIAQPLYTHPSPTSLSVAVEALEAADRALANFLPDLDVDSARRKIDTTLATLKEGQEECATDGCDKPASVRFELHGIGSHYCRECYLNVQAITPAGRTALTESEAGK